MTWIFLSPAPVRMTSNAVCSSSALGAVAAAAAAGRGRRGDGRRGDAELLLERLDALGELEHGDRLELVDPLLGAGGHGSSPPRSQSGNGVALGGRRVFGGRGLGVGLGRGLSGRLGRGLGRRSGRIPADEALVGDLLQLAGEAADEAVQRASRGR